MSAHGPEQPRPGAWRLFTLWAGIGMQSFGGGASTTLLIQRTFIERRRWLTMEEFTRLWGLCLLTPGINLIAVTALIGKRFGGARGMVASLAGLLLPSASITCALAALFVRVEHSPVAHAALRGVVPATAGVMALVVVNFARPLVRERGSTRSLSLWGSGALVVVFALALIVWSVSAMVVVLGAALLGLVVFAPREKPGLPASHPPERKTDAP